MSLSDGVDIMWLAQLFTISSFVSFDALPTDYIFADGGCMSSTNNIGMVVDVELLDGEGLFIMVDCGQHVYAYGNPNLFKVITNQICAIIY